MNAKYCWVALLALLSGSPTSAQLMTDSELFLAPSQVPYDYYDATYLPTNGISYMFSYAMVPGASRLTSLQILPMLSPNPLRVDGSYTISELGTIVDSRSFALRPTIDYSATVPVSNSSTVTFNEYGTYFVRLNTDVGSGLFEFRVGDGILPPPETATIKTGPERIITAPPNNNTTIISDKGNDPTGALANAKAQLPNAQKASTVQEAIDAIKAASDSAGKKIAVSLVGHGNEGVISIGNQFISDQFGNSGGMKVSDFQEAIDPYVSSIKFYSCKTGGGVSGAKFLKEMRASIDSVGAWTDYVTVSRTKFDASATARYKSLTIGVPEPATTGMWGGACLTVVLILRVRRRYQCRQTAGL